MTKTIQLSPTGEAEGTRIVFKNMSITIHTMPAAKVYDLVQYLANQIAQNEERLEQYEELSKAIDVVGSAQGFVECLEHQDELLEQLSELQSIVQEARTEVEMVAGTFENVLAIIAQTVDPINNR